MGKDRPSMKAVQENTKVIMYHGKKIRFFIRDIGSKIIKLQKYCGYP
jgi:hypothetical protein